MYYCAVSCSEKCDMGLKRVLTLSLCSVALSPCHLVNNNSCQHALQIDICLQHLAFDVNPISLRTLDMKSYARLRLCLVWVYCVAFITHLWCPLHTYGAHYTPMVPITHLWCPLHTYGAHYTPMVPITHLWCPLHT